GGRRGHYGSGPVRPQVDAIGIATMPLERTSPRWASERFPASWRWRGAGGSRASAANSVTSGRPGGTIPASAARLYWLGRNPKEPATAIPRILLPPAPLAFPPDRPPASAPVRSDPGDPSRVRNPLVEH